MGDECHIIARQPEGPRGGETADYPLDSYRNLILLCTVHHKLVDDQPNYYHSDYLREIKQAHELWVELTMGGATEALRKPNDAAVEGSDDQRQTVEDPSELDGCSVRSGFHGIDLMLGGFHPGELTVIAGRPMMGKTTAAINLALNMVEQKCAGCLFYSLQHSRFEIANRLVAARAETDVRTFRLGYVGDHEWVRIAQEIAYLEDKPIFIQDDPDPTVGQIAKVVKEEVRRSGVSALLLDGADLINVDGGVNEDGNIFRLLKKLARGLQIPVIATAQCSAVVEKRMDKRPMLRDVPNLELFADVLIFVYRDHYYDPDTDRKNMTELILGKSSLGVPVTFDVVYQNGRLKDLENAN